MVKLLTWITPIWLLSVGVAAAAALLATAFCVCWLVNRSAASQILAVIREGVLLPMSYFVGALTVFAVLLGVFSLGENPLMPVEQVVASIKRLPSVRSTPPPRNAVVVGAHAQDFEIDVAFRSDELRRYWIESSQDVAINVEPGVGYADPLLQVTGSDRYEWTPGDAITSLPRKFEGDVEKIYITNDTDFPADVLYEFQADVEMPQVRGISIVAASVVGLYAIYLLISWLSPRLSVVATATAKETVSQPIFILLMAIGVVALVVFVYTPYNTFGEDVKMLKTSGMTTIKILAIVVALWTASVSVAEEIEGRTALTVLSKPISRRQFILGKFLGIIWPILLMFVILGFVFLVTVSYKVVYDARESAKSAPVWQDCYGEIVRIIPGLVLAFFEAVILAAISVAASTRLPMLPNLVVCGSIYVLGHLAALIVKSSVGANVFVQFVGRLLSVVLPVLDHFEVEGYVAAASTQAFPNAYLGWALLYTLVYCAAAMLLALIFFEDRDLA